MKIVHFVQEIVMLTAIMLLVFVILLMRSRLPVQPFITGRSLASAEPEEAELSFSPVVLCAVVSVRIIPSAAKDSEKNCL